MADVVLLIVQQLQTHDLCFNNVYTYNKNQYIQRIPINVLHHLLEFFMCAALFICHRTCIILCPHGLVSLLEFE